MARLLLLLALHAFGPLLLALYPLAPLPLPLLARLVLPTHVLRLLLVLLLHPVRLLLLLLLLLTPLLLLLPLPLHPVSFQPLLLRQGNDPRLLPLAYRCTLWQARADMIMASLPAWLTAAALLPCYENMGGTTSTTASSSSSSRNRRLWHGCLQQLGSAPGAARLFMQPCAACSHALQRRGQHTMQGQAADLQRSRQRCETCSMMSVRCWRSCCCRSCRRPMWWLHAT